MKPFQFLITTLSLTLLFTSCQQEQDKGLDIGDLHLSKTFPKPGDSLKISYSIDKNPLEEAREFESVIYYLINDNVYPEDINFKKAANGNLESVIKIPDSTKALAFSFKEEEIYYNNKNDGYTMPLYDDTQKQIVGSNASLGNYYLRYAETHNIKVDKEKIISLLKTDVNDSPEVKEKLGLMYLNLVNTEDKVSGNILINEAIYKLQNKTELSEKEYSELVNLYHILRERKKADSINEIAATKFPNGKAAMNKFLESFFQEKDVNKKQILFEKFSFKASSKNDSYMEESMARDLANQYLQNKDYENFLKYANHIANKSSRAMFYNNLAWGYALKDENLDFASEISKASLDLSKEDKKTTFVSETQHKKNIESNYKMFADTYAFILSKQGKMEEAIKYQKPIAYSIKKGSSDSHSMIERYVSFLVKNKQFDDVESEASEFIKEGNGTAKTKEYLKEAYIVNKGSEAGFNDYLSSLENVAEEVLIAELRKKTIDEEAPDFTLRNLNNEEVTLSSLKGKTVILDFWATWCGPCISSFPAMQTAVNKYKDDPTVVFLFIDTWENGTTEENTKTVTDFISTNKYSFNVLFDTKISDDPGDSAYNIVTDYNVSGIPTKFIIGTDGRIKFKSVGFGGGIDGLVNELDQMIKFTQSFKPLKS